VPAPRLPRPHAPGRRRARWQTIAATLAVGLALPACDRPLRDERPDVLVVTLDTTRADHLGCYGYFRDTSPEIDALARESILFEQAFAPMATTLPTHVSVFTATAPLEHGVLANSTQGGQRFVPSSALRPVAQLAEQAGYRTAAFVSAAPLKRDSGIATGFETFDEPAERHRNATGTVDAAIAWLSRADDSPVFAWIHLYDAHWPYEAPPPYDGSFATDAGLERYIAERRIAESGLRPLAGAVERSRESINAYDAEIRYQDAEVGRLLRWLRKNGRWPHTAVLLLGDHGEGLLQHGEAAHGSTWQEQLHAPLLMRVPGVPPRRVEAPLSLVDAMPTFLALLRAPGLALPDAQASGRDALAPAAQAAPILGQDTGRERGGPHRYALVADGWKYFRIEESDGRVRDELYDLRADPHELVDVAARHPERADALRALVEARVRELGERGLALRGGRAPETRPLDPQIREQLEALGYAVGSEAR
jgi:arylsulfatase